MRNRIEKVLLSYTKFSTRKLFNSNFFNVIALKHAIRAIFAPNFR